MVNLLRNRTAILAPGILLVLLLAVACGTDEGGTDEGESGETGAAAAGASTDETFQKIRPADRIYALDDLLAGGFKKGKTYDVEGLEAATAAYYGFYGPDPYNRQEYEVRIYGSHADAVQFGIPLADEGSGDSEIIKDEQTWKEGVIQRRECSPLYSTGSHHSGVCINAKYGDYVVIGNMILMCQGKTAAISQQHCQALLSQIPE